MITYDDFSFVVYDDPQDKQSDKTTYYFSLQDGKPIKLGDGTFGAVYQVVNTKLDPFAVKLLYDNQDYKQTRQSLLDEAIITNFRNHEALSENHPMIQRLKKFSRELNRKRLSSVRDLVLELIELSWQSGEEAGPEQQLKSEQVAWLLDRILVPRSLAVERFLFEMNAKQTIRSSFDPSVRRNRLPGIVNIVGGTQEFHRFDAYKNLKAYFKEQHTQISNYALVMEQYDCTLKDLLERGSHIASHSASLSNLQQMPSSSTNNSEKIRVGYKRMEEMLSFRDRVRHIMPYMLDIAAALEVLHQTKILCHYDLKPANIFVNVDKTGLRAVLGDLGFFTDPEVTESTFFSLHDILPLGTRHYRSPEQKDFFDACEGQVIHEQDQVVLIISDPKFKHTIIEKGDGIIFNKDTSRTTYTIANKQTTDNGNYRITISYREEDNATLSSTAADDGADEETTLPSMLQRVPKDDNTLITFFKKPNIRTDLFGLGALFFDMLTCGESPEQFYDSIRSYDTEENDVDRIRDLYDQVSSYRATSPDLLHLFKPFKPVQGSEYAPIEVVTFILRCMLYKAKNTFYHKHYEQGRSKPIEAANEELRNLAHNNQERYPENNILINPNAAIGQLSQSHKLLEVLEELQGFDVSLLPGRLARGIWFYTKLVELAREIVQDPQKYFVELLPDFIDVERKGFKIPPATYSSLSRFHDDLQEDLIFTKISRNIEDPFVPNYFSFLRRRITLKADPSHEGAFFYNFQSSSLLGKRVTIGDWIVTQPGNKAPLWRVKDYTSKTIFLRSVVPENPGPSDSTFPTDGEGVYYRHLDPSVYYLNMLAIYLYHIFFVGLGNATRDKPLAMNIAESMYYVGAFDSKSMYRREIDNDIADTSDQPDLLTLIMRRFARLYLRLITYDDSGYYYKMYKTDEDRMVQITEEVNRIQDMIASYIGVASAQLQEQISTEEARVLLGKVSHLKPEAESGGASTNTPSEPNAIKQDTAAQDRDKQEQFPQHLEFNNLVAWYLKVPWESVMPPKAEDPPPTLPPNNNEDKEPWWKKWFGK
jgi:serine/threonine protein kinase